MYKSYQAKLVFIIITTCVYKLFNTTCVQSYKQ